MVYFFIWPEGIAKVKVFLNSTSPSMVLFYLCSPKSGITLSSDQHSLSLQPLAPSKERLP